MSEIIDAFWDARRRLEVVLTDERVEFRKFEQAVDGKTAPTQAELQPLLGGIARVSTEFAHFIQPLKDLLEDESALAEVSRLPPASRRMAFVNMEQLYAFYAAVLDVNSKMRENQTPHTPLWEHTYHLGVEFAYFGAITASGSFPHMICIVTYILGEEDPRSRMWVGLPRMPPKRKLEYVPRLALISKRARFLATASDAEIQAGEADWWCDRVESLTENDGYLLGNLIEMCPNSLNRRARERLRDIAERRHDAIGEMARRKLGLVT